jgi:hypothetical protein
MVFAKACIPINELIIPRDQVSLSVPDTVGTVKATTTITDTSDAVRFFKVPSASGMRFKYKLVFDHSSSSYLTTLTNFKDGSNPTGVVHYGYKISLSDGTNPRYYLTGVDV